MTAKCHTNKCVPNRHKTLKLPRAAPRRGRHPNPAGRAVLVALFFVATPQRGLLHVHPQHAPTAVETVLQPHLRPQDRECKRGHSCGSASRHASLTCILGSFVHSVPETILRSGPLLVQRGVMLRPVVRAAPGGRPPCSARGAGRAERGCRGAESAQGRAGLCL